MNNEERTKWYNKPGCIICIAVVIPILLVALTVFVKWLGFDINCSDTILTLIGILATFVVIGNYLQTQAAKQQFESKLSQYKDTIKENMKINSEKIELAINRIEEKQNNADDSIKVILNAIGTFYSNNCDNEGIDSSSFKNINSQKP